MRREDILIAVIDGQGGGMGRALVELAKRTVPDLHVRALGTNALATGAMLKAGADDGATGEGAAVYRAARACFSTRLSGSEYRRRSAASCALTAASTWGEGG